MLNEKQAAACDGKDGFLSYGLARRVMRRMRKRKKGIKFNLYRCTFCRCWHIGENRGKLHLEQR